MNIRVNYFHVQIAQQGKDHCEEERSIIRLFDLVG